MLNKYKDIVAGSFLMILAAVIFIASFSVKRLTVSRIGSQFVPQIVSVCLAAIAVMVIYNGIKQYKLLKAVSIDNAAEGIEGKKQINSKAIIATFVIMVVYIALLEKVGFMIMTAVYLFFQFIILTKKDERKYPVFAIVAIVVSAAIYYIFVSAFQLMLPAGILG